MFVGTIKEEKSGKWMSRISFLDTEIVCLHGRKQTHTYRGGRMAPGQSTRNRSSNATTCRNRRRTIHVVHVVDCGSTGDDALGGVVVIVGSVVVFTNTSVMI
jgi:hypothetical protein